MILNCNFEELLALSHGAEEVLAEVPDAEQGAIAAPSEALATLETLLPRLNGDISVATLEEQRRIRDAVATVHRNLHLRLDDVVVESGPASEESVGTYFDYAYVGIVLERLNSMGAEMEAMIELITGAPPTGETAATVTFPD